MSLHAPPARGRGRQEVEEKKKRKRGRREEYEICLFGFHKGTD